MGKNSAPVVTPSPSTPIKIRRPTEEPSPPRKKLRITIKRPRPEWGEDNPPSRCNDDLRSEYNTNNAYRSVATQPPVKQPKTIHDLFDVQKLLGEGGFGKVYLAVRRSDQQVVALKAIPISNSRFSTAFYDSNEDSLRREVSTLLALSEPGHPHVCRLFDLPVRDNSNSYFAMEYIGGGELFEHLVNKGPFSERDAAKFLRQFADALNYIHSKGYVHSDLKPENLMMGSWEKEEPRLKVVDFGFSVPDDESIKLASYGTVAYLPPECLVKGHSGHGDPWHPNPAGDMFAAGVIIYTVLTGTHPFDRTNQASNTSIANAIIASLTSTAANVCDRSSNTSTLKSANEYLDVHVFDDRTDDLSPSSISLMRGLLHPHAKQRMTSSQLCRHPWILGLTATTHRLSSYHHSRLKTFWRRRFRAAILQKFWGPIGRHPRGKSGKRRSLSHKESEIIFRSMDLNGDGTVSLEELKRSMMNESLSPSIGGNKIKQYMLDDIFSSIDEDGSGGIDLEEFKRTMSRKFDDGVKSGCNDQINESILAFSNEQVRGCILQKFGVVERQATGRGKHVKRATSRETLRIIFDTMDLNKDGFLQLSEAIAVLRETPQLDEDMISMWVSICHRCYSY